MDIVEVVEHREGNVSSQMIPDEPKTDLSEPENDDTGNEESATNLTGEIDASHCNML